MDPILYWNDVALEANRVSHTNGKNEQTGPTLSSRALAILHLAMYDAYAGYVDDDTDMPPYIGGIPFPANASPDAAVAAAAHLTLSELFPSQKPFFDLILAGAGDESDPGHAFGVAVAQQILADRKDDPDAGAGDYKPSLQRGKHRPDPDNPNQGFHGPFYGARSKGFAITARHTLDAPPFDNKEYRRALREVRGKGIAPELMGTLPDGIEDIQPRTVDETSIGIFWGYDGASGLGTPPRLYNQVVRRVAIARGNSVSENARLFAFVNVTMADAGILAWEEKYRHELWRPVVGIREHDKSMGPKPTEADNNISDDCDSSWLPLGAPHTNRIGKNPTPAFPAYPSGHATFGAAAFHITRLFYNDVNKEKRDDLFDGLDFVSDEFDGVNTDNKGAVRPRHLRKFPRGLWQMIEENGRSRVYLGVHWVFDAFAVNENDELDLDRNIGGVPLGLRIAEDIFQAGGGRGPKKSMVSAQYSSPEANKEVVRRLWQDVYNKGCLDDVDELVAENHVLRASDRPEPKIGRGMLKGTVVLLREISPNIKVEYDREMIAEGDKVVSRWTASGTLSPKLKAVGVTGDEVRLSGISVFRFRGREIEETWQWLEALHDEVPMIREEVRKVLLENKLLGDLLGDLEQDWMGCRACRCCR